MAQEKKRFIWPELFYAGLTVSALVFFASLNSIFQTGLQVFFDIQANAQTYPGIFDWFSLPVGSMLVSGCIVLILMHQEVRFLKHKRLDFEAVGRVRWLYALAAICLFVGALYIAYFLQQYYNGTLVPHEELYTLTALWVVIHGPVMARFSTSSQETVLRLGWLRSVSVLLGIALAMLIVYTYFSPQNIRLARQDSTKMHMLTQLQGRNVGQIRTPEILAFMKQETPPKTLYISKDGRTIQEKEGQGLGPFSFKVTGTGTCEICTSIQSPPYLRKRLNPFHPKFQEPSGDKCFSFPHSFD